MKGPRHVITWDAYFMSIAAAVAARSKDPDTNHGAVLTDQRHRILGTGYNGPPACIPDSIVDWSRPAKYSWVIHAEENALTHARQLDLAGCTVHVTGRPCSRCMLSMAARGIRRVVYGKVQAAMCHDQDFAIVQQIAEAAGMLLEEFHVEA